MKNQIFAVLLASAALAASSVAARAADGTVLFKQRCMMCHTVTPGAKANLAPNLAGLLNRKAGSQPFVYSPALKNSKIVWSSSTLDQFLRSPSKMVPGTRMIVTVADDAQRAALVAYLVTLK